MILSNDVGWCWRCPMACWRRALCRPARRFAKLGIGFPCSCFIILLILYSLQTRSKFVFWFRASSRAESHQASLNCCSFRKLAGSTELLLAWLFNITWDSQGCSVNDWCPPRRTSDFCVCLACFLSEGTKSLSIGSLKWYRHLFFYLLLCIFVYFQIFQICQSVPLRKLHLSYCAWLHRIASQQGRQRYAARQEFTEKKRISKRLVLFSYWKNVDCSSSKLGKGNVWTYFSLFVIRTRLLQCVLPLTAGSEPSSIGTEYWLWNIHMQVGQVGQVGQQSCSEADPATGLGVFTATALKTMACCGFHCRHCPHGQGPGPEKMQRSRTVQRCPWYISCQEPIVNHDQLISVVRCSGVSGCISLVYY